MYVINKLTKTIVFCFGICLFILTSNQLTIAETHTHFLKSDHLVTWTPCSINSEAGISAECVSISVPLRWEEAEESPVIDLSIKRVTHPKATTQLWLLQGGPGTSVTEFESYIPIIQKRAGNPDIYMLEQRGIGDSSRLGCPKQESEQSDGGQIITPSEYPPCIDSLTREWGKDLTAFNVTETARDLGEMIDLMREDHKRVFVFGVSYGTYLVHRYLQIYPDQADGIILDSIFGPYKDVGFHGMNKGRHQNHNHIGIKLMDHCQKDEACQKHFGEDPYATLKKLFDKLESGHCLKTQEFGFSPDQLRFILGTLINDSRFRDVIPALIYRLNRCAEKDCNALKQFSSFYKELSKEKGPGKSSSLLAKYIIRSEFWNEPSFTESEYQNYLNQFYFTSIPIPGNLHIWDLMPRYIPDERVGELADTNIPILMLSGTMDPATPIRLGLRLINHLNAPHQQWIPVNRAGHAVLINSKYDNDPTDTCGWDLFEQFIQNPFKKVNSECKNKTEFFNFEGNPKLAMTLFGTTDFYENN